MDDGVAPIANPEELCEIRKRGRRVIASSFIAAVVLASMMAFLPEL